MRVWRPSNLTTAQFETAVKRGQKCPGNIADLVGAIFDKRRVRVSGRRLAEGPSTNKAAYGRRRAEAVHREFFRFKPTFKLW